MTDFGESQAEESLDEELNENDINNHDIDSDEEEEGDDLDKDLEDLIDDNEIEPESDGANENEEVYKKRKKKNLSDAELEDEDYDLIEENLGIKVKRKKFRRIRMESGAESEEDTGSSIRKKKDDSRKFIAEQIFEDESEVEEINDKTRNKHGQEKKKGIFDNAVVGDGLELSDDEYNVENEEDIDDMDDFIVDDEYSEYQNKAKSSKRGVVGKGDFEDEEADEEYPIQTSKLGPEKFYEPAELERRHMTFEDAFLRGQDAPERFLTRGMASKPVSSPSTETELQEEADWIYEKAFSTYPLSIQEIPAISVAPPKPQNEWDNPYEDTANTNISTEQQEFYNNCQVGLDVNYAQKPMTAIAKIREILNFFRNQGLEVPFIAHYRKEYFEPDLTVADLWKIFYWDERWISLRDTRNSLIKAMELVKTFLEDCNERSNDTIGNQWNRGGNTPEGLNPIILSLTREDLPALNEIEIIKVKALTSFEEIDDAKEWFNLYYGPVLRHVKMREKMKELVKTGEETEGDKSGGGVLGNSGNIFDDIATTTDNLDSSLHKKDVPIETSESQSLPKLKKPKKMSAYTACIKAALGRAVTKYFGIQPAQLGKNVLDNYQKYEISQTPYDLGRIFNRKTLVDILRNELIPKTKDESIFEKMLDKSIKELDIILSRLVQMHKNDLNTSELKEQAIPIDQDDEILVRDALVKASQHVFALRLSRDPLIRKCVRTAFYERAKISVTPAVSHSSTNTDGKILSGADENLLNLMEEETHPLYTCKYVKEKPIRDLFNDQFLRLQWGAEQGLVRVDLGMTPNDHKLYMEELRPLIEKDEYGIVTRTWNDMRTRALSQALTRHLYPVFAEELRVKLLREAIDSLLNNYAFKLYGALKIGPYQIESGLQLDDENEDANNFHKTRLAAIRESIVGDRLVGNSADGVKVMGLAYTLAQTPTPGLDIGGSAVVCDKAGQIIATLRLPNVLKNKRSHHSSRDKTHKEEELARLRAFIFLHKPHVIAVGACEGSRLCLTLREELKDICLDLEQTVENFPAVAVVLVEEDVANVVQQRVSIREDFLQNTASGNGTRNEKNLMKSIKPSDIYAKASHALAGKAASLARRVQDPLLEFAQLFPDSSPSTSTSLELDNDIFCLKFDPLQDTLLALRNISINPSTNQSVSAAARDYPLSGIGYYFDSQGVEENDKCAKTRKIFEGLSLTSKSLVAGEDSSSFRSDLHRVALQLFVDRVNEVGVDLNKLLALYSCRQQTIVGGPTLPNTNPDGSVNASSNAGGFKAADELAQTLNVLTNGASGTSGVLAVITAANCVVQFLCGLGPRKGAALLKLLERRHQALRASAGASILTSGASNPSATSPLQNRTQLVTLCHMGPKVFINCAGFIKIDTTSLGMAEQEGRLLSTDDYYLEILDSTRIHPETYEWARKMAVDALEYDEEEENDEQFQRGNKADYSSDEDDDETADDYNNNKHKKKKKSSKKKPKGPLDPASALEAIFEAPDKLKDLDLDAFAEELTRQGLGHKSATLYDIRRELTFRYKDNRVPPLEPTIEERFNLVSKETPFTFYIGRMLPVKVIGIAYVNPKKALERMAGGGGEDGITDIDKAYNPVRNEENGLWTCPICYRSDFTELSEVWQHFDTEMCPGQPIGLKVRLDNGINGFIHVKNISDDNVRNPEEIAKAGTTLDARIIKIDIERFSVEMTCKASDLSDSNNDYRPPKDNYYDYEAERIDADRLAAHVKNIQLMNQKNRKSCSGLLICKRVISHPSFKNVTFHQAQRILDSQMGVGEALIRPSSSKGNDHLTLTWKIAEGVYQYIDIKEEGKDKPFTLGKSLWIGNEEYEDLDEILARFVTPMAALCRDVSSHKYYHSDKELFNKDAKEEDDDEIKKSLDVSLRETKKQIPSRIPYLFCASKEFPGKFILGYTPRQNTHYEYVTLSPQGLRYRNRIFLTLNSLIHWFKEHFKDQQPSSTSVIGSSRPDSNHMSTAAAVAAIHQPNYQSNYTPMENNVPSYTTNKKSPFSATRETYQYQPQQQSNNTNNDMFWNTFNATLAQTQPALVAAGGATPMLMPPPPMPAFLSAPTNSTNTMLPYQQISINTPTYHQSYYQQHNRH